MDRLALQSLHCKNCLIIGDGRFTLCIHYCYKFWVEFSCKFLGTFFFRPGFYLTIRCLRFQSLLSGLTSYANATCSFLFPNTMNPSHLTKSLVLTLPRESQESHTESCQLLSCTGFVDCRIVIFYFTDNIHLYVSRYHICLSGSGVILQVQSTIDFSNQTNLINKLV